VVSQFARRVVDDKTGDEFLVLESGTRYEGQAGTPEYRIVDFTNYALRIEFKKKVVTVMPSRARSNTDVRTSGIPKLRGEWFWRISKVLLVPILAIFALALAYENVRRGRSISLIVALLVYLFYNNFTAYSVAAIKKGQTTSSGMMWLIHLAFLIIAAYLLYRRNYNLPFLPSFSLKGKAKEAKA